MFRFAILIFFVLSVSPTFAQAGQKLVANSSNLGTPSATYRLFPTQNMWTFLKLNTRTGQIWQLQFGMNADSRFTRVLNLEKFVSSDKETNDRFTLHPTQNMYTFILIDQLEGNTWQVQWSTETNTRGIMPIN